MKAAPRELLAAELEGVLSPIFEHVTTELRDEKMPMNWSHFLPEWTRWVTIGFARTWECRGAVAGALFTKHLFSGKPNALLMFWNSTPEARRTGAPIRVLECFEHAAKDFGARPAASFNRSISPDQLLKVYRKRGYEVSEIIFSK